MTKSEPSTRDRLLISAAQLFREKGYHGTGMAEILERSAAPKGSLYHHFPNGKSDLAVAAAGWASSGMLRIIDDAFENASDFQDGATTFCHKLAKFYDIEAGWRSCPISTTLFDGPDNEEFREHANRIFTDWLNGVSRHAQRFGFAPDEADQRAEALLISIQGAWTLARARSDSDVLRRIPDHLFH